jgi:hypothetical protein
MNGRTAPRGGAIQAIAAELTSSLKPSLAGGFAAGEKLATADPAVSDVIKAELNVHTYNLDWASIIQRVDVVVQQWRWDGRPLFRFDHPP